jgi:hypothetical protein
MMYGLNNPPRFNAEYAASSDFISRLSADVWIQTALFSAHSESLLRSAQLSVIAVDVSEAGFRCLPCFGCASGVGC